LAVTKTLAILILETTKSCRGSSLPEVHEVLLQPYPTFSVSPKSSNYDDDNDNDNDDNNNNNNNNNNNRPSGHFNPWAFQTLPCAAAI